MAEFSTTTKKKKNNPNMFNLEDLYLHRIAYADFDGVGFDG